MVFVIFLLTVQTNTQKDISKNIFTPPLPLADSNNVNDEQLFYSIPLQFIY